MVIKVPKHGLFSAYGFPAKTTMWLTLTFLMVTLGVPDSRWGWLLNCIWYL
jgi:hypothetical protein